MNDIHPDAALRAMLEDRPRLRLILRDRDYGMPCPENRWQVKAAIDALLKPALEGMVLDVDILEDEDDVLVIGVVDLDSALPRLRDLLERLRVPAGAILLLDGREENLAPELPARDERVRHAIDHGIQQVTAECVACSPHDRQSGTLTIQYDGNWLAYSLKNAWSNNIASISEHLKALCEELAVLMWKNGDRWREAVLRYEGTRFTLKFDYDEPLHPIGRPSGSDTASSAEPASDSGADPGTAKRWWKVW
ncbi:hypothetical protein [Massilia sp. 9096]|uniref:hypothetical protein n=1 Tax=Massilia sp. 9096 TaxID=1500894 RepID=UPI00056AEC07|nr:hypothetical protein [Massilia sp. 9096]